MSTGAFLGIQPDSVTCCSQTEYAKELRTRPVLAYQRAIEQAKKQAEIYKVYYEQKVRENELEVSDRVLVENVEFTSKHKIADISKGGTIQSP